MKPRTAFVLAILALWSAPAAHAKHSKAQPKPAPAITLSEQDKQHLLHDALTVVRTVREIPEPVRKQLLGNSKAPLDGMADFGKPFQMTDVVGRNPPPFRRLIFAATSQGYCLVYYEFGGYGYGQMVTLFRLSGDQAERAWTAQMNDARRLLSLPELRDKISVGRYLNVRQE